MNLEEYTDEQMRAFAAKPHMRPIMEQGLADLRESRQMAAERRDNALADIERLDAVCARLELALRGGLQA